MRPWNSIPIRDCGQPLLSLPPELHRLEPHPYAVVGAPYGPDSCPFRLRAGVIERLLAAQRQLQEMRQLPGSQQMPQRGQESGPDRPGTYL